jgi:hypothetical protein
MNCARILSCGKLGLILQKLYGSVLWQIKEYGLFILYNKKQCQAFLTLRHPVVITVYTVKYL